MQPTMLESMATWCTSQAPHKLRSHPATWPSEMAPPPPTCDAGVAGVLAVGGLHLPNHLDPHLQALNK